MTTIYVPKMLSSELTRFKDNNGNILLDYRSTASGDRKVLNTPYDLLLADTITAAVAPLEVTGTHVSGDNNNFRTISIDYLILNDGTQQYVYYVFLSKKNIVKVERISTISMATYFETTFNIVNSFIPIGATNPLPLSLTATTSEKLGLVDKLYCKVLEVGGVSEFSNITLNDMRDIITVRTPKSSGSFINGEEVPSASVPNYLKNVTAFTYSNGVTDNALSKLSIISKVSASNTTVNSNVLSSTYPNYGSYILGNGGNLDNIFGFSFILKQNESVLLSQIIRADMNPHLSEILLASPSIGVSTSSQLDGSSYFNCIKAIFPATIPTITVSTTTEEGTTVENISAKFFTSVNDNLYSGTTGYTVSTKTDFIVALKSLLEPLGFIFFPRKNDYWFIYNYGTSQVNLRFAYSDWKLEVEEDISKTQSIHNSNTTVMNDTIDYLNTSLGVVETLYIDRSASSTEEIYKIRDELTKIQIGFTANPDRKTIDCMYNYITLRTDNIDFATQTVTFTYKIDDGVNETVTLDYTSEVVANYDEYYSLLQADLENELGFKFNITFNISEETVTLTNNTLSPFKFYYSTSTARFELKNTYTGLYDILPSNVYFFIISKGS